MKPVVDIPGKLLREAEKVAASNMQARSVLVTDAIQAKLESDVSQTSKPWAKDFGSLRHLQEMEIRDHVWIGDEVSILALDRIKIGFNTCVSQRAWPVHRVSRFRQADV